MTRLLAALPLLVLAACAARPPVAVVPTVTAVSPPLRPQGLDRVLGRTADELVEQFGKPELDIREAAARKLQFRSGICVLDAYLYAPQPGAPPVATYLDARLPNGLDMDRASCVAAIARRDAAR